MSGQREFLVPDLGEGLEEVTLTSWNVDVDDHVELNQPLCSVETAKAEVEIPSPYAGRIVELGGAPGDVLAVGAPLVRIDTGPAESPVLVGYGVDASFDTSHRVHPATGRPRAKPAARKLAAELGVDLAGVAPGPRGVITPDDVLAASAPDRPADSGSGVSKVSEVSEVSEASEMLPVGSVQAAMAERMTLSRSRIPDAHASVDVDCTSLLRLRDRLDKATGDTPADRVTPFVLTLRLLVIALTHHPALNSTWVDTPDGPRVRTHRAVHLGFGVAAPRGLLVPVVTDAHRRTTRELAGCVARLIRDARAGVLKPSELAGSTFTVSNFGALGLDDGVPVINYPEAAIVGMGSLKPRPVVVDGAVTARPQMTLTCAFDHRVVDGAQVAGFLGELRGLIEAPDTALLDL